MAIYGPQATGPGMVKIITGFPVYGYTRFRSAICGLPVTGVTKADITAGTPATGARMWATMAVSATDMVMTAMAIQAVTGNADLFNTTPQ